MTQKNATQMIVSEPRDVSDPSLLPHETPLAMPEQDFGVAPARSSAARSVRVLAPRVALFGASAMLMVAFAFELYNVLSVTGMTPLQAVFLVLSTLAFGWIALGSLSAAMGFLPLFSREPALSVTLPDAEGSLWGRTALLFPVYHEDAARIAGTIEAIAGELDGLKQSSKFDVFVLSDTRGDEAGAQEECIYRALRERLAKLMPVYYRRRFKNYARKAGNIQDWVERFGAGYDYFVILDGDSVMSGETLVRLARAMEADPKSGLIQTVPRLTGGATMLQRLQQFAAQVYGPLVATGLACWHRDEGNYWGHNAIIRTEAFAGAAGLPELPGRAPFGGHIQSHDFVEAVLLQRAGYGVHMAPALEGSYEGLPPNLMDLVVRDRRWAQGNLQHLGIAASGGITGMGRVHLLMGAFSYLVSAVWAASLVLGVLLALQSRGVVPDYFPSEPSLFPLWPVMDPGAAARLFMGTMAVVLLPKMLGLWLEIRRARAARETFATLRAFGGVAVETVFSMLLAPILMMTQTVAVTEIMLGRDSGWKPQSRANGEVPFGYAMRFHAPHMVIGVMTAVISYWVAPALLVWMSPVVLGLLLAGPLSWLVAQPASEAMGVLLSTPEDRAPPAILERVAAASQRWRQDIETMPLRADNDTAQAAGVRAA
ncbi:MAG: glucans biosynthesis glucosyltransferase MdoH [Hyphomicrobiaceae bacterium]|nr:glucans biosynthesis glucosyltransferase MdoH [Hyphomicrobiaceae bacterium]